MITRVLPYDLTECACILHLHVYSIQVITLKISIKVIWYAEYCMCNDFMIVFS